MLCGPGKERREDWAELGGGSWIGNGVRNGGGAAGRDRFGEESPPVSPLPEAVRNDYSISCCNSGKVCAMVSTGQGVQRLDFTYTSPLVTSVPEQVSLFSERWLSQQLGVNAWLFVKQQEERCFVKS